MDREQPGTRRKRVRNGTARKMSHDAHLARINDERPMMSVDAAAKYLGVSRWTVYRMINAGHLPIVKFGPKLTRVYPADLDALLDLRAAAGL